MSSDRSGRPEDEPEDHGVLEDTGIDTTAIGILGTHTAQVRVVLPQTIEDPDDDVVDDVPGGDVRRGGIVIELPADEPEDDLEVITGELDEETVAAVRDASFEDESEDQVDEADEIEVPDADDRADGTGEAEPVDAEPGEPAPDAADEFRADAPDDAVAPASDDEPRDGDVDELETDADELETDADEPGVDADESDEPETDADEPGVEVDDAHDAHDVDDADERADETGEADDTDEIDDIDFDDADPVDEIDETDETDEAHEPGADDAEAAATEAAEPAPDAVLTDAELTDAELTDAELTDAEPADVHPEAAAEDEPGLDPEDDAEAADAEPDAPEQDDAGTAILEPVADTSAPAARERRAAAHAETLPPGYDSFLRPRAVAPAREQDEKPENVDEPAPDGAADAREEDMSESTENAKPAQPITRPSFIDQPKAAPEPARKPRETASRRAGELNESAARESTDVLTADRLLDSGAVHRPEPEGPWRQLVYRLSGHLINLGDSRKTRERKELSRRISAPLNGAARFVPVLSRKGGVGKTTVTALLGMALADARDDRVIAVDANPDRGTLAERIARTAGKTVRDLVRNRDAVHGYADMSSHVVRDETRLDVLASDTDPHLSEAFSDQDYRDVADVAAHYYSIVLTDTGTGIVHSVMGATLDLADQIVVVAGLSVDEARLASETLTWLESNGFADQVRQAVVVLNQSTPGAPLVRLDELDAHFRSRVRAVVRIPYDPQLATGSAIVYGELAPATRDAARELAARVVEGLRQSAQGEP